MDFARHGALQDVGGLPAGAPHVHVGIGLVRHDDVRQVTHGRCHVGVQIQRDGNWQRWADHRAQTRQQLAFAVFAKRGHHGAV